jgi:hypothetical protein
VSWAHNYCKITSDIGRWSHSLFVQHYLLQHKLPPRWHPTGTVNVVVCVRFNSQIYHRGIPSVCSLTLALSRNPRLFCSKCQERLKERCATQIVVRILENSGHWHASTNSISLVGNYESFTTIIAILTYFTSKMDVKHFGNLLLAKILYIYPMIINQKIASKVAKLLLQIKAIKLQPIRY